MKYKSKIVLIIIIVLIVGLSFVLFINNSNSKEIASNKTIMQCIIDNSVYYTSLTCLECVFQEEKLGEYKHLFNIIDCTGSLHSPTVYNECQIMKYTNYPTWIINEKKYIGVQSLSRLKRLIDC